MDITTLWQEHRTFIISVVGGLLLFFVAEVVISNVYALDEKTRTVKSLRSDLSRLKTPSPSQVQEARQENTELVARYDAARERIGFKPDPKYLLSKQEKPDIQYDRLFNEARDTLVEGAKSLNITVDSNLGMPELSPTRQSEIQRALLALDMVTRVVLLAIESQIMLIDSIEMVPQRRQKKKSTFSEQRVSFKMTGSGSAMAEFLRRFTLQENYLALEEAEFEMGDKDGTSVRAQFTVAALKVIEEESEQ